MDWKILFSTFGLIFLAELGDKTQIATLARTMESKSPLAVFIGSSLALMLASFLAVFVGTYLRKFIPLEYIGKAAGVIFIILGIIFLIKK
ncbi:MAG: TMEM165/GDT1 family protein [Spirochaetota bacterium]|nr:TMEM165/GDT1 family protein [Spirochaetota bacterium]